MGWLNFLSGQGEGVLLYGLLCFFGQFRGLVSLLVREVGVGKCWQVKVVGERVFVGHLECMRDVRTGC